MSHRRLTAQGLLATMTAVISLTLLTATLQAQTGEPESADWTPPSTPWGDPDLQGVWDYRTITPLERPREFAGKEFLSDEEAADWERRKAEHPYNRPPGRATNPAVHAPWWLDYGNEVVESKRTSLIVDPPDGRIPPVTEEAKRRAEASREHRRQHPADSHEDRSLFERCLVRGLPRIPAGYNNNYQIFQTPKHVVIFNEMIHLPRIVPLDGRDHLPESVRQWNGDSRGRWEGQTLIVETTNFSEKSNFRGSGANLHLVERFTRVDADTVAYQFTVEDATTWTRPWTALIPLKKSEGPIFEYACHEGNYALPNILRAARVTEKTASK